ncbi:Ferric/cupric reductase transmembrane component 1 [Hypsizygus marmoreus]|uniref:ferric-chelate reductase (NADPH) n=1 Tax=Hypsizygus marmoreus TaxID=39966 RepID=A0A369K7L4_HYPMA|nr:Ferric/cupric reductase transmembrane component 1 [Hypsizygus marmoreus]
MSDLHPNSVFPNVSILAPAPDPDKPIRIARFFSYPDQVLYLVASFIGLIVLCHFASLIYTVSRRGKAVSRPSSGQQGRILWKRLPIALLDTFRAIAFRWTVPVGRFHTLNVAELFLTAAYTAVLFTWTLVNTTTTTGIKVEAHYWANRAGTIAATQLPIMTALGMRNNIVSLLTGVSFDKLNILHRMSARVLCVLVWLHGAGRIKVGLLDDEAIIHRWVQCGFLAGSALAILCITTVRPIRERSYEVFLMVHFILAFVFLLSVYFHAKGRRLVFYGIWPSFLLWGLDRLLRLVRVLSFNPLFKNSKSSSESTTSSIEVLSPHFLRITVPRPPHFHWLPGQSTFLAFPGISTSPFESHPFTISTIDDGGDSEWSKKLVFLVRVRKGATHRLLDSASANGEEPVKVVLDGPYSSPPLLVGFDTVVLVAGGSGVAFTLPLFLDLLSRAKQGEQACCNRIVFAWAVRDVDHVRWISNPLQQSLRGVPSSISVEVRIFITTAIEDAQPWDDDAPAPGAEAPADDIEVKAGGSSHGSSSDPHLLDLDIVSVQQGRPDLKGLLGEATAHATGPISVNVCGTHALATAVRKVLRRPRTIDVLRGGPSITLHIEAFGSS